MAVTKRAVVLVVLTLLVISVGSGVAKLHPGFYGGITAGDGATIGWIGGELLFPVVKDQIRIDFGGDISIGFGSFHLAIGPKMKLYFIPGRIDVIEPNITLGGGFMHSRYEVLGIDYSDNGGYLRAEFGMDFMLRNTGITPFLGAGVAVYFGDYDATQFLLLGGVRL